MSTSNAPLDKLGALLADHPYFGHRLLREAAYHWAFDSSDEWDKVPRVARYFGTSVHVGNSPAEKSLRSNSSSNYVAFRLSDDITPIAPADFTEPKPTRANPDAMWRVTIPAPDGSGSIRLYAAPGNLPTVRAGMWIVSMVQGEVVRHDEYREIRNGPHVRDPLHVPPELRLRGVLNIEQKPATGKGAWPTLDLWTPLVHPEAQNTELYRRSDTHIATQWPAARESRDAVPTASRRRRIDVLDLQDWWCLCCDSAPASIVEHDHMTGRIRGGVCPSCNSFMRPGHRIVPQLYMPTTRYGRFLHETPLAGTYWRKSDSDRVVIPRAWTVYAKLCETAGLLPDYDLRPAWAVKAEQPASSLR